MSAADEEYMESSWSSIQISRFERRKLVDAKPKTLKTALYATAWLLQHMSIGFRELCGPVNFSIEPMIPHREFLRDMRKFGLSGQT
jgi:hypothetical protein